MQFFRRTINQILSLFGLEIRRKRPRGKGHALIQQFELVERAFNSDNDLILIFQMAGVGSLSLRKYLTNNGLNPFNLHALSETGMPMIPSTMRASRSLSKTNSLKRQQLTHEFLRSRLFVESGERLTKPTKIITVFREPIDYLISHYFKALHVRQQPGFTGLDFTGLTALIEREHGALNVETLTRYFLECVDIYIETYVGKASVDNDNLQELWGSTNNKDTYIKEFLMRSRLPLIWFDLELKGVFGFDIYLESYDREQGYGTYKVDDLEILVIDFERLNEVGARQTGKFVKIPDFETASIPKVNLANERASGRLYEEFRSSIVLPTEFVDYQYSSQYAKFFYSEEKLDELTNRWTSRGAEEKQG